jgi:hypothetical protein
VGSMFWVWQAVGAWAGDALVYRAGAVALLAGADPWSAGHAGWSFAALPITVLLFVPGALLPEPLFVAAWQSLMIVSAVVIVRRLRLAWWWTLFPPLTLGVILGNPAVPALAALLAGLPVVGLSLRPQLLLVAGWRSAVVVVVLVLVSLALMLAYITSFSQTMTRYAIESGAPINLWGGPGMVVSAIALALLATEDRRAAAWLVAPAFGPGLGWYGYTMVMPVASVPLAVATSLPVHGIGAWAVTGYALIRFMRARDHRTGAAVRAGP